MSRQIRMAFQTVAVLVSVVSALSGCAPVRPAPVRAQPEVVQAQKDANARYAKTLTSFILFVSNAKADSRAQILQAYQGVLYEYSLATLSYVRVVYPTLQTLPPSLQPLPAPSGTPTVADVNRDYEHTLDMRVATWDIGEAATWGKKTKMSIPAYVGEPLLLPVAPPLPPFQDARDPKYARLVAMTQQIEDAQKAALEQERRKQSEFVGKTLHPVGGATPPPQPQSQPVQRWCTVSGQGVTGRVPC
ncbi:hypothetical protein [Ralstonia sp. 24A2]|uniref:hypothetical protein n=1 Tax=Ralstonia sp. 24A2 TaxID=3447364 RepID=UPI003F69D165